MKWKGYFESVDLMLEVVDFSFEFIILFLKIADEKSGLLWDKQKSTSHGIELLIKLIELGSFLLVESLVIGHGKKNKRHWLLSFNDFFSLIFFINSN